MIGVVIGTTGWQEVARMAADRMSQMTGLECRVVTELFCGAFHPSWQKAKLIDYMPDVDSFMVFDADIMCLRPWNPEAIFESLGRPFCAVIDRRTEGVFHECHDLGIGFPDTYVNGGLTIFGREHKPIWDCTWSRHPKCGRFLEQGALNLALMETDMQVCRLPKRFNVVTSKGEISQGEVQSQNVVNLHATNLKFAREVAKFQEKYGSFKIANDNSLAGQPH